MANNQGDLENIYSKFQGSDEENQNNLLNLSIPQKQTKNNDSARFLQDITGQFVPPPVQCQNYEGTFDVFKMENTQNNNNSNGNKQKKMQYNKQMPLQQALIEVTQKLSQKSSIQNKISGLKLLSQKINQNKNNKYKSQILCTWLEQMKFIQNMLHQDSHPQILRNILTTLKFLYQNNKVQIQWINMLVLTGLRANQQYAKVVQALLSWIKVQHLVQVFQLMSKQTDLQNHNFVSMLMNIVNNKYFVQENLEQVQGKGLQSKQKNILTQQLQNFDNFEPPQFFDKPKTNIDKQYINKSHQKQSAKILTTQLFNFLIQATDNHMNIYYPILNKLITSKYAFLANDLASTLPQLIKNGKINAVWIVQHCLRIDFGQANSKKNGPKNHFKNYFITRLANQNLYQHLLMILARTRFNKTVVDKILNIFILLSKNYKPLQQAYTQYIWKILGLNSREQKQREQFFNFVKDILRNQSNFTEQSVNFIFFQVLMSLKAQWFSLKILDCLQMLFMRLNQDLKLISYINQTYQIQDSDLVGIDKFWHIYFYSNDAKVTKKSKDFLWKLTTYSNNPEIKIKLLKEYISRITFFMTESQENTKIDFCQKGFQIIDKLMEEVQKKQMTTQLVQLVIKNQCRDAIAPKNIDLRLSQKCRLQHLKQHIALAINPPNSNIKLLARGQFLKGDKMTLKQHSITSGMTIMVTDKDDQPIQKSNEQKDQNLKNTTNQLIQLFGSQINEKLLKFIAQKMDGQQIDRIVEALMNEQKLAQMSAQFQQINKKAEQDKQIFNVINTDGKIVHLDEDQNVMKQKTNPVQTNQVIKNQNTNDQKINTKNQNEMKQTQNQEEAATKFSFILVSNAQYIKQLLQCGSYYKRRSWQTIKSLPQSYYFVELVRSKCEQQDWQYLFPKQQANQMICIYYAYIVLQIIRNNKNKIHKYMIEYGGFIYLINWLKRLPQNSSHVIIQQITNLLVITLQQYCPVLENFKKRLNVKPEQQVRLLGVLIDENGAFLANINQNIMQLTKYGDTEFFKWLLVLLLKQQNQSQSNLALTSNIVQIVSFYVLNSDQRMQFLFQLELSEIYYLIQTYGFAGQYIFLMALSKLLIQQNNFQNANKYCDKLLNLVDYGFDFMSQSLKKHNIIYAYDIVGCILDKTREHPQKQKQITLSAISSIKNNLQDIPAEQLASLLSLLKLAIFKIHSQHADPQIKKQIQLPITQFAQWLFTNYLFQLQKMTKHTRNKIIRKNCYEVLQLIAKQNLIQAYKLIDKIVKIQLIQRNKDEDYIDFRNQDYIGLTNLGATCYINSLLQQLYHTKFSTLLVQKDIQNIQQQRLKYLKQIFMQLSYSNKNVVNPKQFIRNMSFYGQPINTSVQQDAMEFLLCLFDYIEGQGYQSQIYQVFGGYLCNQITVDDQQPIIKENKQHFNSLTIDILGKKNLQQALAYFIKPQTLDGQNKYFCEQLGKKMKASKRCYIQKMPNILIITLKRFEFDYDNHSRHKLNDYFEFPLDLDMHRYSGSYLRDKQESSDSKYKLTGILVHSGSAQSGHYYSYIKIGEHWLQFNDKTVSQFNVYTNIKNDCFGCSEGKKSRSAYMLFYQKVNSNYHGVYLDQIPQSSFYKRKVLQQNQIFLKSRLIYDDNFRKFLSKLLNLTNSEVLDQFMNKIYGKKQKNDMELAKQNSKNEPEMIYYDADENQPLMKNTDEMDEFF